MPFGGLVVDADKHLALRAADLHRGALGAEHGLPIVAAADVMLAAGVLHDLVYIQYAGVVVKGHVQTGDLQLLDGDPAEQIVPAFGGEGLERPAALAGHLYPYAHILPAVVVDTDAGKVFAVTVAVRALGLLPRTMGKPQCFYELLRGVVLACK